MKVLVCGGRQFNDAACVSRYLNELFEATDVTEPWLVIHGDCDTGADRLGAAWARIAGAQTVACRANWTLHGRKAGPMRNHAMLELCPDVVLAFPGGKGTADMVRQAERQGIRVIRAAVPTLSHTLEQERL